ncbi:MAG: valine dehydrogenase [Aeromicrobium sp.]|jgi:valine dehydrogenase (NAD+)|nr:valine dehydrogenase [Aeromicrobium sp.]
MAVDVQAHPRETDRVFDQTDDLGLPAHEQVVFCRDESSGLRAIISIHSTALGPALGGTRFFPYRSENAALTDGLRLSRGMTCKAALAGMPLGGGKAVIIGDPALIGSPDLLRAYGRFVETLGGRYVTAADVGTTSDDLDVIGEQTQHVVGRTIRAGGSGDSGLSTAYGVFCAMQSAAERTWGSDGLRGRTVGIEGVGKVGFHLVGLLLEEGARVIVSDPNPPALDRVTEHYEGISTVASVIDQRLDVYAPCALGATLTHQSVSTLSAQLVCGAANNQLLTSQVEQSMRDRGIVWVPDFVANAGGLIQVGGELLARTEEQMLSQVEQIRGTVSEILATAQDHDVPIGTAALRVVRSRLEAARVAPTS